MTTIRITLSDDFDKRYETYRKKIEGPLPEPFLIDLLNNEKTIISRITDSAEYQIEIEKWKPLKIVMDAIYAQLSPFEKKAQEVSINLAALGVSENVAHSILKMLFIERVCRSKLDWNSSVVSTVPISEYMSGKGIVVKDYEKFRDLRKIVQDFLTFLEDNRKQNEVRDAAASEPDRAPDAISNRDFQVDVLKTALEQSEEDALKKEEPDEVMLGKTKTVGKWSGEELPAVPVIDYNDETGTGMVNGKKKFKFKDGSPEYKVFKMLYAKVGKKSSKLERNDVLIAGGFYEDHEEPDPARKTAETEFINDVAKNIREKTGLTTDQLVNNGGNLTLVGQKRGKSPPKTTKFVPVWG